MTEYDDIDWRIKAGYVYRKDYLVSFSEFFAYRRFIQKNQNEPVSSESITTESFCSYLPDCGYRSSVLPPKKTDIHNIRVGYSSHRNLPYVWEEAAKNAISKLNSIGNDFSFVWVGQTTTNSQIKINYSFTSLIIILIGTLRHL